MATDNESLMNLNTTSSPGVNPLMQATLNRYVLKMNRTQRKYTQFGQRVSIPQGRTKTLDFDKLSPLPKATQPLVEGITPKGSTINITRIKGEPTQHGNYVSYTDQLDFFANDPSPEVLRYAELLGENQISTYEQMDAMTLASGLNVFYASGATDRDALNAVLKVDDIRKAVAMMKTNKVRPAAGNDYIAFVHPLVVADIWKDDEWVEPRTYQDTTQIYNGEIGKMYGVRFIEDPDAYVYYGDAFSDANIPYELTVVKVSDTGNKVYVAEDLTSAQASAIVSAGYVWINGKKWTVTAANSGSNGEAYITITGASGSIIAPDMVIHDGSGYKATSGSDPSNGKNIYSTVIIGGDAFGTSGDESVEIIPKGLGTAGTNDPLNQRGTMGWKGYHFFKILNQLAVTRIESLATIG